jgi:putative transcriptional regulator
MAQALTLVATPRLAGSVFERKVIIAAPLSSGMHVGFIVNHPTELKLAALFPEQPSMLEVTSPVYIGGPVEPRALFALARTPPADKGGLFQLMPGLVVAVEAGAVEHIIETSPNDARYFLGLLVWEEGELDEEIRQGVWEVQPADIDMVFSTSPQNLWKALYRGTGTGGIWAERAPARVVLAKG